MKLRNKIGQWRQAEIFERRFKLPKVLIKIVVVLYAGIGLGTIALTLKTESVNWFHEITQAKTIVIEGPGDTTAPASEEEQPVEDIDVYDCNTAVDYWTKELQIEGEKELLKRIVNAESGNDCKAANRDSTARGCSQFLFGTWESQGKKYWGDDFYNKNIYNPSDNVELMARIIRDGGISHWNASAHIWQ